MVMLSAEDRKRIADAVSAAEEKTSGEITCALAEEVSNYREVPLAWAALVALGLPPLLVLTGLHHLVLIVPSTNWMDDSARSMDSLILRALSAYSLLQVVLFVCVALIVALPGVRRSLTPGALKSHRVRQVARHHFAAIGGQLEQHVPHILIFASLKDRRVELVAHKAIHDAVGQGPWNAAVSAVSEAMKKAMAHGHNPTQGYIRAVEICGEALTAHYPSTGEKTNRLSNEIEEM
jgi:putative membrane protein